MNRPDPLPGDAGAVAALVWTLHPARAHPARLPVLLAVILAAAVCVYVMFHAWLPSFLAAALLVGAIREYLFPITYRLTGQGVEARGPGLYTEMTWEDVRRVLPLPGGLVLSPLRLPSRLDAFRGVSLHFAATGRPGDRNSVLQYVHQFLPAVQGHPDADQETDSKADREIDAGIETA